VLISHVGGGNADRERQAHRIYQQMPLATADLLMTVIALNPGRFLNGLDALGVHEMAAEGSRLRPALFLSAACKARRIRCHRARRRGTCGNDSRHSRPRRSKSRGSKRHGQPLLKTSEYRVEDVAQGVRARPTPGDFDGGKRAFGQAHSSSERSVGYFLLMPRSVQNHPNPLPYQTRSNPTVTLSVIGLCSVRWSTVRGPNIGHFGAFLGSLKGVSGLLDGSLGLSVTVDEMRRANPRALPCQRVCK
jgi:hypothetical protein